MRVLALGGAHVIGTARTKDKGAAARDSVAGNVTPVVLELADFDSVVDRAAEQRVFARGFQRDEALHLPRDHVIRTGRQRLGTEAVEVA